MAQGQGASMALPIYGKYISKVYADPKLPYTQTAKFSFSEANLCEGGMDFDEYPDEEQTVDEIVSGAFD